MIAGHKTQVKGRIDFPMAEWYDVRQGVGDSRTTVLVHVGANDLQTALVLGETGPAKMQAQPSTRSISLPRECQAAATYTNGLGCTEGLMTTSTFLGSSDSHGAVPASLAAKQPRERKAKRKAKRSQHEHTVQRGKRETKPRRWPRGFEGVCPIAAHVDGDCLCAVLVEDPRNRTKLVQ